MPYVPQNDGKKTCLSHKHTTVLDYEPVIIINQLVTYITYLNILMNPSLNELPESIRAVN